MTLDDRAPRNVPLTAQRVLLGIDDGDRVRLSRAGHALGAELETLLAESRAAELADVHSELRGALLAGAGGVPGSVHRTSGEEAGTRVPTERLLACHARLLPELVARLWPVMEHDPDDYVATLQSLFKACLVDLSAALETQAHSTQESRASQLEAEERLHRLAFYDPLTGLPNRTLALDRLQQALAAAHRHGQKLALLSLDLDGFQRINDSLGHEIGDQLLRQVARRLLETVRDSDTVARPGNDEFLVLLNEVSEEQAGRLAHQIGQSMHEPFCLDGHELRLTCSIGVALNPHDGAAPQTLLRNAEAALHRAKAQGRETVLFYAEEMNRQALARLVLQEELHRALAGNELVLHYQPRVDLRTGEITAFEALVRWRHPTRGLVPPDAFIPVAEESGLIVPLGEWVLREACRQAVVWKQHFDRRIGIAVNMSARQFRQTDLVSRVAGILKETGVDARHVELELTESTIMECPDRALAAMAGLSALGLKLAIDDFGTGYSSLGRIKELPVSVLKIDKSFVAGIPAEPNDTSLVTTIIAMAHHFKLRLVAEGVETEAQLAFLCRHGCDEVQGYLFSRPRPPDAAERMLADHRRWSPSDGLADASERTLLLVDDEEYVLTSLQRALRHEGYRVLVAHSAQQAFDVLAASPIGVVICDHRMSAMNGVELLRRVRQIYPDIVRIILSGYFSIDSLSEAINAAAVHKYLAKPWDDETLRTEIRESFERYEQARDVHRLVDTVARLDEPEPEG